MEQGSDGISVKTVILARFMARRRNKHNSTAVTESFIEGFESVVNNTWSEFN